MRDVCQRGKFMAAVKESRVDQQHGVSHNSDGYQELNPVIHGKSGTQRIRLG